MHMSPRPTLTWAPPPHIPVPPGRRRRGTSPESRPCGGRHAGRPRRAGGLEGGRNSTTQLLNNVFVTSTHHNSQFSQTFFGAESYFSKSLAAEVGQAHADWREPRMALVPWGHVAPVEGTVTPLRLQTKALLVHGNLPVRCRGIQIRQSNGSRLPPTRGTTRSTCMERSPMMIAITRIDRHYKGQPHRH